MRIDIKRLLRTLGIESEEMHSELWAKCPYPNHTETEPSWSINETTGQNHCFGCERGGSALDLIIGVVEISGYAAAIRWVIDHNLDLESTTTLSARLVCRKPIKKSLQYPKGLVTGSLNRWVTPAKRYMNNRGIDNEQISKWNLSYCTDGFLNGRIFVPVLDRSYTLMTYAARTFTNNNIRYLTPEGGGIPGAIFGEQYWKGTQELILCEGAFNGLACERAGAKNIGALCGSNLDKEHVLKLSRFGSIIVASDLDSAGNKLANKLKSVLSRWKNVRRIKFPKGMDANDIANRDIDKLRKLIHGTA